MQTLYKVKQKGKEIKKYSIKEVEPLINDILSKVDGVTEEWICMQLDYNEGFISQLRSREKKYGKPQISPKFYNQLKNFSLQNATNQKEGVKYERNPNDPAYLAGQLAMAERLIAKLESDHAEAKADKEKLFSVLAAAQNTINDVLKPIKEKTEIIETNSETIRGQLAQVARMVRADDQAMMEGTDRILGRESGTTSQEASIVEHAFGNQGQEDDTNDKKNKMGKADKAK